MGKDRLSRAVEARELARRQKNHAKVRIREARQLCQDILDDRPTACCLDKYELAEHLLTILAPRKVER